MDQFKSQISNKSQMYKINIGITHFVDFTNDNFITSFRKTDN